METRREQIVKQIQDLEEQHRQLGYEDILEQIYNLEEELLMIDEA